MTTIVADGVRLHSTAAVADALGVTRGRVWQIARDYAIAGRKVGRDRYYTDADLEQMRQRRPIGKPRKDARHE